MTEDVQLIMDIADESMKNSLTHLEKELMKLRAGKANPSMLDSIKVDYYGQLSPLNQIANVGTQDAQTIVIQPWDKSMTEPIEKEIMKANLGFNPVNKGDILIINVPPLTEERRRELVKFVKAESESCKISIRNARRDAIDGLKDLKEEGLSEDIQKKSEDKVQKLTDDYSKKTDQIIEAKEKDIMTV